jgi:hypothetical protein
MRETKNAYKSLVRKPEGKSLLGRSRLRWKCNIKLVLKGIGCKGVDWTEVA